MALVTGASAGIGECYARHLARRGYDLILTARREERLLAIAGELGSTCGVSVEVIPADLTSKEDLQQLEQRVRNEDRLSMLVNNAGFGVSGGYIEQPVEKHQRMIDVHISATVRLSHAVLPGMIQRRKGYIVNVSSIAGFIPAGGGPGYTASKAYLNYFSTNLQAKLAGTGVRIQSLCPGYTYTEFHNTADYQGNEREELPAWVWMSADEVVACSLRKLDSGKVIVVPGFKNRLVVFFLRSRLATALMNLRNRVLGR